MLVVKKIFVIMIVVGISGVDIIYSKTDSHFKYVQFIVIQLFLNGFQKLQQTTVSYQKNEWEFIVGKLMLKINAGPYSSWGFTGSVNSHSWKKWWVSSKQNKNENKNS